MSDLLKPLAENININDFNLKDFYTQNQVQGLIKFLQWRERIKRVVVKQKNWTTFNYGRNRYIARKDVDALLEEYWIEKNLDLFEIEINKLKAIKYDISLRRWIARSTIVNTWGVKYPQAGYRGYQNAFVRTKLGGIRFFNKVDCWVYYGEKGGAKEITATRKDPEKVKYILSQDLIQFDHESCFYK